jgi:hypothetical protein
VRYTLYIGWLDLGERSGGHLWLIAASRSRGALCPPPFRRVLRGYR